MAEPTAPPPAMKEQARELCGDNHCYEPGRLAAAQDNPALCDHCKRILSALTAAANGETKRCARILARAVQEIPEPALVSYSGWRGLLEPPTGT